MVNPKKALRYTWIKRSLTILSAAVTMAYFIVLLESGLTFKLRDFSEGVFDYKIFTAALYGLIFILGLKIVTFLIDFISGYFIEHRFGISNQKFLSWAWDQVKELGLGIVLNVPCIAVLYYLLDLTPWWWLWATFLGSLFMIFLTFITPILLLPLFIPCRPLEDEELRERLLRLAEKAGTEINGIFSIELSKKTKGANAALAGLGRTRRILLSDTLLKKFSPEQIEVIMGHELTHHKLNHMWKGLGLFVVLMLAGTYICNLGLKFSGAFYQFTGISDIAALPYLLLVLSAVFIAAFPIFNFFSRKMEFEADAGGVELGLGGGKEEMISALERLGEMNLAPKAESRLVEFIFLSHPTINRRIARLSG